MTWKQILLGFCALCLIVTISATTGAVDQIQSPSPGEATQGDPDLDVYLANNEVEAGSETTVEFQVQNDGDLSRGTQGDRVLTARSVSVDVADSGPFDVKSGETAIGTVQDGAMSSATAEIAVPSDVEPGSYDITVETSYSYDSLVSDHTNIVRQEEVTESHDVTVVVTDGSPLVVKNAKADVEPGGTGTATVEVLNTGEETLNQSRTTISATDDVLVGSGTSEEYLGTLYPDESATVHFEVTVEDTASEGTKPLEASFIYQDENGIERESGPETIGIPVGASQSFSIDNLEDTLAVGYDGEITGKLTNDGPRAVDDAVLIVEPMSESLFIEDTRYALPELDAGETTTFRYPTDVSGQADEGPRQLRFSVEYTGSGDATLENGPISERVFVDPQQDEFSLTDDGITVPQGEQTPFELVITNERQQTLSNIDAKLYTDSPLQTSNDEAFVPELAPGESATMTFDVAAAADTPAETHPVELDFEYETERGDTTISDVYQHPIDVEAVESDDDGSFIGSAASLMAALTAVGLGLGFWWRRT